MFHAPCPLKCEKPCYFQISRNPSTLATFQQGLSPWTTKQQTLFGLPSLHPRAFLGKPKHLRPVLDGPLEIFHPCKTKHEKLVPNVICRFRKERLIEKLQTLFLNHASSDCFQPPFFLIDRLPQLRWGEKTLPFSMPHLSTKGSA